MERYVWISKLAHHPIYRSTTHAVLRRVAEQCAVEVTIAGADDLAAAPYLDAIQQAIRQHVAGIMLVGWKDPNVADAVNSAMAAGIPVVTVESDLPGSRRLTYAGTEWLRLGTDMARKLVELAGPRGQVLVLGMKSLECTEFVYRGFRHELGQHPALEIIGPVDDSAPTTARAFRLVQDHLRVYPDLTGIAAFDCNGGPGAAGALEETGLGFDPVQAAAAGRRKQGFGLFNIRERLDYIGGRCKIASRLGRGTQITLVAPLRKPPAADDAPAEERCPP